MDTKSFCLTKAAAPATVHPPKHLCVKFFGKLQKPRDPTFEGNMNYDFVKLRGY